LSVGVGDEVADGVGPAVDDWLPPVGPTLGVVSAEPPVDGLVGCMDA
jgi:hypothetical protein